MSTNSDDESFFSQDDDHTNENTWYVFMYFATIFTAVIGALLIVAALIAITANAPQKTWVILISTGASMLVVGTIGYLINNRYSQSSLAAQQQKLSITTKFLENVKNVTKNISISNNKNKDIYEHGEDITPYYENPVPQSTQVLSQLQRTQAYEKLKQPVEQSTKILSPLQRTQAYKKLQKQNRSQQRQQ